MDIVQHGKSVEWSKFPQVKFPSPTFQSYLENLVCHNTCFPLFSNPFFISKFIRTTSLKLRFQNLNIGGDSEYIWKRLNIFFQLFYFGFFKKIIRLLTECVKPICKLFFPKCLVVLGKGSTWEKRMVNFMFGHILSSISL